MDRQAMAAAIARVEVIEAEAAELRQLVEREPLAPSQRQYLSRCFDLLDMELSALRQYLARLG